MDNEIGLLRYQVLSEKIEDLNFNYLKQLLKNFKEGFENTLNLIALPYLLVSKGNVKERSMQLFVLELIDQELGNSETPEEKINEKISSIIDQEKPDLLKEAYHEIETLKDQDEVIGNTFDLINYNTLTNSWAIFESVLKDLWTETLNRYPKLFFHNVIKAPIDDSQISGIDGKQISLPLLSKYEFDLSSHLGTILSEKYDFTSVQGIEKAYDDLFKSNISFSFINDKQLNQLEVMRHNIVHKGGVIDEHYLKRSLREEEILGEKLSISVKEVKQFTSVTINVCVEIFMQVNKYLAMKEA